MESLEINHSPYIKDLNVGILQEGHFLVKRLHLDIGKKNKPFLRLLLSDKTGHLPAIIFGNEKELQQITSEIKTNDIVNVYGIIEEYQDVMQLKIMKIKQSDSNLELNRFWKRTPYDRRELYKELKAKLNQIHNKELNELCFSFLKDREFLKLFLEAPASRYVHHAYIGGLLEHTLHVVKMVDSYCSIFDNIDRSLILAGAFLHDIGKVDEYIYLFEITHSSVGKLKGHTLLGYDRLQKKLNNISLDENLRLKLEHIILSHQGKRIWGAVEEPKFLEAYLIHAADSTDSAQFIFTQAKKRIYSNKEQGNDFLSYSHVDIYLK